MNGTGSEVWLQAPDPIENVVFAENLRRVARHLVTTSCLETSAFDRPPSLRILTKLA